MKGLAALAWSLVPNATYQDVRNAILGGVDPLPALAGITGTGGRLNARNTLAFFTAAGPFVTSHSPAGIAAAPVSSIDFNFSEAMNTGSFAVADDVASFTGPSGNLLGQITGFSWVNSNTTLHVTFDSQSASGTYTI